MLVEFGLVEQRHAAVLEVLNEGVAAPERLSASYFPYVVVAPADQGVIGAKPARVSCLVDQGCAAGDCGVEPGGHLGRPRGIRSRPNT